MVLLLFFLLLSMLSPNNSCLSLGFLKLLVEKCAAFFIVSIEICLSIYDLNLVEIYTWVHEELIID
mgnify:CR=1 FL=1